MRPAGIDWPSTRKDTDITAGVPGLGLSGLFVLLSGLALPLARRWRGQRVPVARLFGLAVIMIAAIIVTWEVIFGVATALHTAAPTRSLGGGTLVSHSSRGLPIIAISFSILVLLIATGEALLHLVGVRPTPTPPPVEPVLPVELLPGRHERQPSLPQELPPAITVRAGASPAVRGHSEGHDQWWTELWTAR
jgi:hypothetical protein